MSPFFWQDVANSSKEMFVEHFLLRKKWRTRLKDYTLMVVMMGMIFTYGKFIEEPMSTYFLCRQGIEPSSSSTGSPTSILCVWFLFTLFVCVTAESASIMGCVLKKMKRKRRFRLQQQQAKKSTKQTKAA